MGSTAPPPRKVFIITGATVGTSRNPLFKPRANTLDEHQGGIGHDLAERLHARGHSVAIAGRRAAEGEALAARLDPSGDTAAFVPCHVEDYDSQARLFRAVWARWARLDGLVANAGIVDVGSRYNLARRGAPVDDVPPRPDLSCSDVDFKAVVYGTELAVHYMRHNPGGPGGKIVITGSIVAIYPLPTLPEYCAVKAAALQWARVMAPMLGKENITINTVLPNAYNTGILPNFEEAYLEEQYVRPSPHQTPRSPCSTFSRAAC